MGVAALALLATIAHAPRFEADAIAQDPALPGIASSIAALEYDLSLSADGVQAPNRAQGLRTYFRATGLEVVPRQSETTWRFAWRTSGWGREGRMRRAADVEPRCDGVRAVYERDGWTEWYENRAEGVEQWFTIHERVPGAGALRIEGRIAEGLGARHDPDAGVIDFVAQGCAPVLRYSKLIAWDARGRELASRMELDGGSIALVVDDAHAAYPVTIDPLLNNPLWSVVEAQNNTDFGFAVATAGDVNGDGYSDVIVGAPLFDGGQIDEGRAFVFLGSSTGPSTVPVWAVDSDSAFSQFGFSVATAGDVDGDGFDDILVGAPEFDDGHGRVYIYLGGASGPDTLPAWSANGPPSAINSGLGFSVAAAGDVNGDTYDDIVVGAIRFTNTHAGEGIAYVYHGSASGPPFAADWSYDSNFPAGELGCSVSTAGDVNGDGYADIIVGARRMQNGGAHQDIVEGMALVFLGGATGLETTPIVSLEGNSFGVTFGTAVSAAGDVNGDGYADVIVGAPHWGNGQASEGKVFVYRGIPAGLDTVPIWEYESNFFDAQLGTSVGTAGDVNGDGIADVIFGGPYFDVVDPDDGIAYVYTGSALGGMQFAWSGFSNEPGARFGTSVGTAGDTDGDGFSEILVGAPGASRASVYPGSAYTLTAPVATADSDEAGAALGYAAGTAGDVNGDGFDDVIVGAPFFDVGAGKRGRVFVYPGQVQGLDAGSPWILDAEEFGNFGAAAATAGDVNGDGYADVIVGSPAADGDSTESGIVRVYHGSATGLDGTPDWTMSGDRQYAQFGFSVGTAGDVNGDGYADVIIGAPLYSDPLEFEGAAYVYLGSPGGLAMTPHWAVQGEQLQAVFGGSVATAGDVNADGYSDIIVGATGYDGGGPERGGGALVYHGSAGGLGATPDWIVHRDIEGSGFGRSVATAGDVNGDGYSDVVIGASGADNGQPGEGMAWAYHGSAAGLSATPSWEGDGDQINAQFGAAVGTAGDINGDGCSEIIVAMPTYSGGALQNQEGRTEIYLGSPSGLQNSQDVASRLEGNQGTAYMGAGGRSVGTAGDVNADGFADVIVGAWGYDDPEVEEGKVFLRLGNRGSGDLRAHVQLRVDGAGRVSPLGMVNDPTSVRIETVARGPAGRTRVLLEIEVKPTGTPFDGTATHVTPVEDTGPDPFDHVLSRLVTGLDPATAYRWRARLHTSSPYFPRTRWFWPHDNSPGETDFRTRTSVLAIDPPAGGRDGLRLAPAVPNPFHRATEIRFTLPRAGRVRLAVYDLAGRETAVLDEGWRAAGRHSIRWTAGSARAGVYYARLLFEGGSVARPLVLAR
jgi:hypothetical protein